jgi:DNA repair protein RecO (recombination protein O)
MALITTHALVLHAFPYGETSKIVRLLTRDHGVQSAIAKGALRPKSKFGARLQVMSEGVAQLYLKPQRDLHTLAEFDVTTQRSELAKDVPRYAAAAALGELIMRFAPSEPHPEIYDTAVDQLDRLANVPAADVNAAALAALWAIVGTLGFAPSVHTCARDGGTLPEGKAAFSVADGGLLCDTCARGTATTTLEPSDRKVLERLIAGASEAIGPLSERHSTAHRRLLVRFVERHVAEGREVRALTFWQEVA